MPSRYRFTVLSSGYPVLKFAGDGEWLYINNVRDSAAASRRVPTGIGFRRLLPIPIRPEELMSLLSGRIPISDHHTVDAHTDGSSGYHVLVLKKWWRPVEKIYLCQDTLAPVRVEAFGALGSLRYRACLDGTLEADGYRIPVRIDVSDGEDAGVHLSLDRYWSNVAVSADDFALTASPLP